MGSTVSSVGGAIGKAGGDIWGYAKGNNAQQAPQMNMTQPAIEGENNALGYYQNVASGNAPTIAGNAFQQNLNDLQKSNLALAASQRGASNPLLAFRQAQMQNQTMGQDAALQAAMAKQQEIYAANQAILNQAAAQRGVAANVNTYNAGLRNEAAISPGKILSATGQVAAAAAQAPK